MPLGELLEVLQRDADAEIRDVIAAATADAKRIDDESQRTCAERLAASMQSFAVEKRAIADTALAAVDRQARRRVLAARAAMLDRLRTAIAAELPGVVDPLLRAKLLAAAVAHASEAARIEHVPTGVIADDGCIVIDATLDAVLERAWPRLASEAVAIVDTSIAVQDAA